MDISGILSFKPNRGLAPARNKCHSGVARPPAHTASPGGLDSAKAASLLWKLVPLMHPDVAQCIANSFCVTVKDTDIKGRFNNLAKALERSEQLVDRAVLAYEQTLQENQGPMRKLVSLRAHELATAERKVQISANMQSAMQTSKFSACFRPAMNNRALHEQQIRSVQKTRVASVSNVSA